MQPVAIPSFVCNVFDFSCDFSVYNNQFLCTSSSCIVFVECTAPGLLHIYEFYVSICSILCVPVHAHVHCIRVCVLVHVSLCMAVQYLESGNSLLRISTVLAILYTCTQLLGKFPSLTKLLCKF